ncbi:NlpC/P60 family protein [Aureimonas fodinaquatilis]|uniref:NlpC/P60 family protein n=1 Tax=Aureimonas fodinaquatilis TaxID=2565783 RepID=A0A5B0DZQ7_9HYPH|nr:NlpC/P60 family protein [Aureimonas fodinaquatilis]KAA0972033.1 NlpC/P60 family protein [Aureimonas fodinaquatilis]
MLDKRRNAFRPDLADAALRGQVTAADFVEAQAAQLVAPLAPLRRDPEANASLETEALLGERVSVFEQRPDGWCWVQLLRDGYVGWMEAQHINFGTCAMTHEIHAPRTLVFPVADIKQPPVTALPMGAQFAVADEAEDKNARYFLIEHLGWVVQQHGQPLVDHAADYASVAQSLMGAPYLWGGKSALGLDCSGLVQLSTAMAGYRLPRDADMQEKEAGSLLSDAQTLCRGDLVFWKGHVGIMLNAETLLHANVHHMAVAAEPLANAVARAESRGSFITCRRRLG